ncbi:MAG: hypothetical protein RIR26_2385 [Pseudomonadota bacterium]
MKTQLVLSALLLVVSACGKDDDDKTVASNASDCDSALTFDANIKSIVTSGGSGNCASCHSGYSTLSGIQSDKSKIYSEVASGSMPKGNSSFKSSTDGKNLLAWLSCSTLK